MWMRTKAMKGNVLRNSLEIVGYEIFAYVIKLQLVYDGTTSPKFELIYDTTIAPKTSTYIQNYHRPLSI
ncbi:hypothetical protein ACFX13_008231 [Malus domestica]